MKPISRFDTIASTSGPVSTGSTTKSGCARVTTPPCRPAFFLPLRVLSRLFGRLFLEKLAAAHAGGLLHFFGGHAHLDDTQAFAAFLSPLRQSEWVVYRKRPFGGPEAVLAYLSRYTHRAAIANSHCSYSGSSAPSAAPGS